MTPSFSLSRAQLPQRVANVTLEAAPPSRSACADDRQRAVSDVLVALASGYVRAKGRSAVYGPPGNPQVTSTE